VYVLLYGPYLIILICTFKKKSLQRSCPVSFDAKVQLLPSAGVERLLTINIIILVVELYCLVRINNASPCVGSRDAFNIEFSNSLLTATTGSLKGTKLRVPTVPAAPKS
jgi:hypothetical protein